MIKILKSGQSVQGRKIELVSLTSFDPKKKSILLIACAHGNEKEGVYCVEQILEHSEDYHYHPDYNFLCIPCLNPDGFFLDTRDNANGVNLNRNMPTKDWISGIDGHTEKYANFFGGKAPASEPETQFLLDVMETYDIAFILTLHAPLYLIDINGPSKGVADKLSAYSGYPVGQVSYPTPGTLGTWAGHERQIPTITYEFTEGKTTAEYEAIWQSHKSMFKWFFEEMDALKLKDKVS